MRGRRPLRVKRVVVKRRFDLLISADSHVNEPTDLWSKAMGKEYGERAPHLLEDYNGVHGRFYYTGLRVLKLGDDEDELRAMGVPVAAGYAPESRAAFQEQAGIDAEIVNPTVGLHVLNGPDRDAMHVAARVYNDWMAEFVGYDPRRIIGVAIIPTDDIDWAVAELERVSKMGLWGAMINMQPLEGCPPYRAAAYDPLWAAAQHLAMPLTLHLATGRARTALSVHKPEDFPLTPGFHLDARVEVMGVLGNDFIFGRILDRFSELDIICGEFDISWLPWFAAKMDELQEGFAHRLHLPTLERKASEYAWQRVWHGVIDDPFAVETIRITGADTVLWGSDFPHVRSIGLDAHERLARMLDGLPAADQAKVAGGNAARLMGR